jgi:hypothetical protein
VSATVTLIKKKVGKALDKVLEKFDPLPPLPPQRTPPSSSSPSSGLSDMDNLFSSTVNNTKGPGAGGTLDQRLHHILAVLMETKSICEQNQKEIVTLKEKIIFLEKENNTVKRELRAAKESTNRYELASRFLTVRVLGLPVSAEEHAAASPEDRNKAAVKNAYDKILKPILSVAKAKGHLEVVPQLKTTIEEGFRINSNAKDKRGVPSPLPSSSDSPTSPTGQRSSSSRGRPLHPRGVPALTTSTSSSSNLNIKKMNSSF